MKKKTIKSIKAFIKYTFMLMWALCVPATFLMAGYLIHVLTPGIINGSAVVVIFFMGLIGANFLFSGVLKNDN